MINVSFPLRGTYITPNTPGTKVPSHGLAAYGEEYAIDFVMVPEDGSKMKPYSKSFFIYLFKGLQLSDFYGWGTPVYAPLNGEVVAVESSIEERNPVNIFKDYKNTIKVTKAFTQDKATFDIITGNYVIIKSNEHCYTLLAHLQKDSVTVKVGQKVTTQDIIGKLGHSGNSTMPHLHMQFMDSMDYKNTHGIPFVFNNYEEKQNDTWVTVHNKVPRDTDIIRFLH